MLKNLMNNQKGRLQDKEKESQLQLEEVMQIERKKADNLMQTLIQNNKSKAMDYLTF